MVLQLINKDQFLQQFLAPVSKINTSCVLKVTDKGISTLLAAADNTAILYAQYKTDIEGDDVIANLPDIGRLINIMRF